MPEWKPSRNGPPWKDLYEFDPELTIRAGPFLTGRSRNGLQDFSNTIGLPPTFLAGRRGSAAWSWPLPPVFYEGPRRRLQRALFPGGSCGPPAGTWSEPEWAAGWRK